MIHHGGYGSCQTGLYTGTPAVIIPTYSERESNARRVAALGAGEAVIPADISSGIKNFLAHELHAGIKRILKSTRLTDDLIDELKKKVRKILSDTSYAENAGKVSRKMSAYGGASQAAQLIERLIQ